MTDAELLEKVKEGLGISAHFPDPNLSLKTTAVKAFMLNAGISESNLTSPLGIATLTIGVNDLWNLAPGEVIFSDAFTTILMPQLMVISLP